MALAALVARLTAAEGTSQSCGPLDGVSATPGESLEDAAAGLSRVCGVDFAPNVHAARLAVAALGPDPHDLTDDEAASIHLYTQMSPAYSALNGLMRAADRNALRPIFPLLKILCSALNKLPRHSTTVYRGVSANLAAQYSVGMEFFWWQFTSCTEDVSVLQSDDFLGSRGDRTMFVVTAGDLVSVQRYSAMPTEGEYILFPGTCLEVTGVLNAGNGLFIIQVQQKLCPQMVDALTPRHLQGSVVWQHLRPVVVPAVYRIPSMVPAIAMPAIMPDVRSIPTGVYTRMATWLDDRTPDSVKTFCSGVQWFASCCLTVGSTTRDVLVVGWSRHGPVICEVLSRVGTFGSGAVERVRAIEWHTAAPDAPNES